MMDVDDLLGGGGLDLKRKGKDVSYEDDKEKAVRFLEQFVTSDTHTHKYMVLLQQIANRTETRLGIHLDDVVQFEGDVDFVEKIQSN